MTPVKTQPTNEEWLMEIMRGGLGSGQK